VRTPLTDNLFSRPGFYGAVLEPEDVAEVVVKQILSGRGGQLVVPKGQNFLTAIRGFPSWYQESIRDSGGEILRE
jgi:all-trans-retinol dehydrogenase (NAD+)